MFNYTQLKSSTLSWSCNSPVKMKEHNRFTSSIWPMSSLPHLYAHTHSRKFTHMHAHTRTHRVDSGSAAGHDLHNKLVFMCVCVFYYENTHPHTHNDSTLLCLLLRSSKFLSAGSLSAPHCADWTARAPPRPNQLQPIDPHINLLPLPELKFVKAD